MTVKQLDDVVVKISPWILALTKKKKKQGLIFTATSSQCVAVVIYQSTK
jgi:hypothetical protein